MPKLTRSYLKDHMINDAAVQAGEAPLTEEEIAAQAAFADDVIDAVLRLAMDRLTSESDEHDELELSIPVRLHPVPGDAEAGVLDCIEVCVGIPPLVVCYHRQCRGKRCGEG